MYHRGNHALVGSLLNVVTRWIVLLTLPVFAWLVVAGEPLLGLFGREFVVGYTAVVVLAVAELFDSTSGSVSSCLAMTKYQRYNVYNIAAMAVVSVVLNALLIPRMDRMGPGMGLVGASAATAGAIVLVNMARLIEGKALLGLVPFDRSTIKVAVTGTVLITMAVAARWTLDIPKEWYWVVALLVICYAVTAGLTLLLGVSEEDRVVLASLMRKLGRAPRA